MLGICKLSWIPIRADAKSSSEIVSSLIFGETYKVISNENPDWFEIVTDFDQYKGFISSNQFEEFYDFNDEKIIIKEALILTNNSDFPRILTAGSVIRGNEIKLLNYHDKAPKSLIESAKEFLGVPYLWGGRSVAGVDCSGFVQIVFKINGIAIPRDSSKQFEFCQKIDFDDLKEGDLVFFGSKDKINHVGLYMGENKIIHSSGKVRVDTLKKQGIIKNDGKKTHDFIAAGRPNNI